MATREEIEALFGDVIERRFGAATKAATRAMSEAARLVSLHLGSKGEWLFSDLDELTEALERALEESGADRVLAEFVRASEEFAKAAQTIPRVRFGSEAKARLQDSLQAKFAGWHKTVNEEAIGLLRDRMLTQTVAPISSKALSAELEQVLTERIAGYADTYVEQALSDQARATWLVTGDELGAEEFTYLGAPPDEAMRPFCEEHYGKTYTRAEIDAMDNGQGLSVWEACGGWKCRHQWIPVV